MAGVDPDGAGVSQSSASMMMRRKLAEKIEVATKSAVPSSAVLRGRAPPSISRVPPFTAMPPPLMAVQPEMLTSRRVTPPE